MRKSFITLLIVIILLLIFNIFTLIKPKTIFSVNNHKFNMSDIALQQQIMCIIDSIEEYSPENAIFDLIRQQYFIELCRTFNLTFTQDDLSDFQDHLQLNTGNNSKISDIKNLLGKDFNSKFLIPYFCSNLFIDFILYDSLNFQKDRYEYSKTVLKEWKNDEFKSLLNDYCEYIEYNSSYDEHRQIPVNTVSEDISYYYVLRDNGEMINGLRIMKHSADSIIANLPAEVNIKFFDKAYMFALQKICADSYWHSLIFKN